MTQHYRKGKTIATVHDDGSVTHNSYGSINEAKRASREQGLHTVVKVERLPEPKGPNPVTVVEPA